MSHRCILSLSILTLTGGLLVPADLAGQSATAATETWTPPRTSWGAPDLQGIWANNNVTPLERPTELAGKELLTDKEVAELKQRATQLFGDHAGDAAFGDQVFQAAAADAEDFESSDGGTGNYNYFWLVERDWSNRTSLVVDPPDGQVPAMTPQGQARVDAHREARRGPARGPEDRSLGERCITFGVPRLGAGYNSYYQILQTQNHVVVIHEMIHDARIISLDGRPHLTPNIRQWHGDSRGRWEGDTLVVETTNYSPKSYFRGATDNLRLVERFTRVSPDTMHYEVNIEDPTTWTRPWTVMIPLKRSEEPIFEYACHEGNIGMEGILAGARAEEKALLTK